MARLPVFCLFASWAVVLLTIFHRVCHSTDDHAVAHVQPLPRRLRARLLGRLQHQPSAFTCLVKTPSCVCGGNRSVAPYAAMRGIQAAISTASTSTSTRTITTTRSLTITPSCTPSTRVVTSTRSLTVSVTGDRTTVTAPARMITAPASTVTSPPRTITGPTVTVPGANTTITAPAQTLYKTSTLRVTLTATETAGEVTYTTTQTDTLTTTFTTTAMFTETETQTITVTAPSSSPSPSPDPVDPCGGKLSCQNSDGFMGCLRGIHFNPVGGDFMMTCQMCQAEGPGSEPCSWPYAQALVDNHCDPYLACSASAGCCLN
ncbi:hypothetical protein V8E36_005428 [Tilletia maclaganii]